MHRVELMPCEIMVEVWKEQRQEPVKVRIGMGGGAGFGREGEYHCKPEENRQDIK